MSATDSYFDLGRDALLDAYRQRLAAGQAVVQRCAQCGAAQFPPGHGCRVCGGRELHWSAVERGTVVAVVGHPDSSESAVVVEASVSRSVVRLVAASVGPAPSYGDSVVLAGAGQLPRVRVVATIERDAR